MNNGNFFCQKCGNILDSSGRCHHCAPIESENHHETVLQIPKLVVEWSDDFQEFIQFWSASYKYPREQLYDERINNDQFSVLDIEKLYFWKNNGPLSQKKEKALREKITNKIMIINDLKKDLNLNRFLREFETVSAIWKIFLLHIIAPKKYPIFDQHVYRAYSFLKYHKIQELPPTNRARELLYFEEYVKFFHSISTNTAISLKKVDEALWAFGRFLKTRYSKILLT